MDKEKETNEVIDEDILEKNMDTTTVIEEEQQPPASNTQVIEK